MARYLALTDLFGPAPECRYVQAGTSFDGWPGWPPPTHAVNPLDGDAMAAYQAQGPRLSDVEPWRQIFTNGNRWVGLPVPGPSVQWVKQGEGWVLTGTGG
jgi:hypothetical protein